MDLGLRGRTALVTGASRGLGRQAALSLAGEGANLVVCARGQEALEQTAGELRGLGVEVVAVAADTTVAADCERVLAAAGAVDIVVNNVGGRGRGGQGLEETSDEDFEHVFQLNLLGALRLTRAILPGMRERGWGRVVNVASIYGREHGGTIGYMTGKAALIAATKHLALQVAKDGILVNCVAPGSVLFPGGSWERFSTTNPPEVVEDFIRVNLPLGRFGWPEPVGDLIAYLASERAGFLTGACVNIDGGQSHNLF